MKILAAAFFCIVLRLQPTTGDMVSSGKSDDKGRSEGSVNLSNKGTIIDGSISTKVTDVFEDDNNTSLSPNASKLSDIVASEQGVSTCLNLLTTAAVCSLGSSQGQACCAAVEILDYHGCFCDSIFNIIVTLDNEFKNLRENLLPICMPAETHFQRISQCPSTTFLSLQQKCHDDHILERRLSSVKALSDAIALIRYKKLASSEEYISLLSDIVHENITATLSQVGVYTGIESFVEYVLLSSPVINNNLMEQTFSYSYGWHLSEDGNIAFQTENQWTFFGSKIRWISALHKTEFSDCDDKILGFTEALDSSLSRIMLPKMIEKAQPWSVENFMCPSIIEHCSDPSLNVSEFEDTEACVAFQRSLPNKQCDSIHQSMEGNTVACKLRHAFMVQFRPNHHCPHTGTGNLPDDRGKFVCVPDDCSKSTELLDALEKNTKVTSDRSKCTLNGKSTFLLHLSSLGGSSCSIPLQVLTEIFQGFPSQMTSHMLQDFCQPNKNNACPILRLNLQKEYELLMHHCGGVMPESTLPSIHHLIQSASDLNDFQQLVCMAREDETAENKVCQACTEDDLLNVPSWIKLSKGSNTGSQISKFCRQTLHFVCSNAHKVPALCDQCFLYPDSNDAEHSCLHSLNYCAEQMVKPEIDPKKNADPYPGDSPPSDTTYHDIDSRKIFDFIIVGAGNSGCVIARRLSDDGYSVLVLEAGSDWQKNEDAWDTSRKRRQAPYLLNTVMVKKGYSAPNDKLLGRPLEVLFGNTLGGSTSINAGLYSRPAQEEFEMWPEKWKSRDVLPFFKKLENYQGPMGVSKNHGKDGLLTVQPPSHYHTLSEAWIEAAKKAGIDVVVDGASGSNNDTGIYHLSHTFKDGRRQDAFTAYLLPIMPRDGLEVRTGANVANIIYEEEKGKQRATGVVYMIQGLGRVLVHARREIILSAGWAGSPKLLMMSGVGPKENLEELKIKVGVRLEGVGQQLVGRPLMNLPFGGQRINPEEMPWMFASEEVDSEWALNGTGILDMSMDDVYGKAKSGLDVNGRSDFLMSFSDMVGSFNNAPLQTLISSCKVCRPESRGNLKLRTPNPSDDMEVSFDMLRDERDMDILVTCVKKTLSVYKNFRYQGLDLIGLHEMNNSQLRALIRSQALFSYDAWGTCRMGDGALDVVEPDGLRVRGFSNLRVIDGSVMPEGLCSGPMSTTYMIAERGAAFILDDLAKEYVSGTHVVDQRAVFIIIFSIVFFVVLVSSIALKLGVNAQAKIFSKVLYQEIDKMQSSPSNRMRMSATTLFLDDQILISENNLKNSDKSQPAPDNLRTLDNNSQGGHSPKPVKDLSIYFSRVTLDRLPKSIRTLSNATGQIKSGQLTLLMGTSGAGKSTLLDILSVRVQSAKVDGSILYSLKKNGAIVVANPANQSFRAFLRRNIAYLKQSPGDELAQLTVFETLMFSYMLRVAPNEKLFLNSISIVDKVIRSIGLADHKDRAMWQLSGGQKRRLQIGASLLDDPLALFLDEPTSGLDQNTAVKIIFLLKQIAKARNIPVVVAIHHPGSVVLKNTDSMYLLFQGYGVFQGDYKDLEHAVNTQSSYQRGECPLDYTFDYIGKDAPFRQYMYKQHILKFNNDQLPDINRLMEEADSNDPNKADIVERLQISSLWASSITLFSLLFASFGSKKPAGRRIALYATIHLTGLTIFALSIVLYIFVGRVLPVDTIDGISTITGLIATFTAATIVTFQVSPARHLTTIEAPHLCTLIFERLLHPEHVTVYWILQGFQIVLGCIPGFMIFYFSLGFQIQNTVESILLFLIFCLQAVTGAQAIQLYFGAASGGVYGLYSVIQLLLGTGLITSTELQIWIAWIRYINPVSYYFSTIISLEFGVDTFCGEICGEVLERNRYDNTDLLLSGIILSAAYIIQILMIHLKIKKIAKMMENNSKFECLKAEGFEKQEILEIATIESTGFDMIDTRRLFQASIKPRPEVDEFVDDPEN